MQKEFTGLSRAKRVRSIFAASSGNFVEWFDFYIYVSLTTYFTHHFFDAENETVALIQSFGVFAIGFFMRPIGSLIFGSIADKVGRQKVMIYAILLMSLGNFLIAFTPSKETIGIWAPILLLLARCIQGISVGGEGGLLATYIAEISTKGNRGFFSSFQYVTLIMAQFVALGCVWAAVNYFGEEMMKETAWRYLFVLAGFLALGSLFLRMNMEESAQKLHETNKEKGSFKLLWKYRKYCLLVLGLTAGGTIAYYNFTAYMHTYLSRSAMFDKNTGYTLAMCGLAFAMIINPIMGAIGDRVGVKKMLASFGVLGFCFFFVLMYAIIQSGPNGSINNPYLAFLFIAIALIITGFYTSIAGVAKATLFPEEIRAFGTAFPYAIAVACFGGTVPSIALWFKTNEIEWGYFVYMMCMCIFVFIVALNFPKETELEKQSG